jgi:hypothetical protein
MSMAAAPIELVRFPRAPNAIDAMETIAGPPFERTCKANDCDRMRQDRDALTIDLQISASTDGELATFSADFDPGFGAFGEGAGSIELMDVEDGVGFDQPLWMERRPSAGVIEKAEAADHRSAQCHSAGRRQRPPGVSGDLKLYVRNFAIRILRNRGAITP